MMKIFSVKHLSSDIEISEPCHLFR